MNSVGIFLHDHFIPHKGNEYQPHFLRTKAVAGILTLVLVVEALYLGSVFIIFPKSDYLAAIFATVLVDQTNDARADDHLALLTPNPLLEKAARMKAEDMATKGYFSHNTPDGKNPWYWFKEAGYSYLAAGENLAVNFTDSSDVTEAWMRSPTHRANIMNGNYTEIGIATAEGVYKGRAAIFVVEEFGRPALVAIAAPTVIMPPQNSSEPPLSATPKASIPPPITISKPETATKQKPAETTSIPSVVAGAETVPLPENPTTPAEIVTPSAHIPQVQGSSPLAAIITAPRHVTTMFYLILGMILTLALGLAIFIETRIQHPHIILNGLILIAILASLAALNATMSFSGGTIFG